MIYNLKNVFVKFNLFYYYPKSNFQITIQTMLRENTSLKNSAIFLWLNFLQLQIFTYENYWNEKKNKDAIYVAYNMCLDTTYSRLSDRKVNIESYYGRKKILKFLLIIRKSFYSSTCSYFK